MSAGRMRTSRRPRLAKIGIALVLALGLIAQQQRPAEAGVWAFGHGWQGETTLHGTGHARAGIVEGLWETILVAHYGPGWFPWNEWWDGDGETFWTAAWQREHRITADGIVGPQTWAAARWFYVRQDAVGGYVDPNYEYWSYRGPAWVNGRGFRHSFRRHIGWDNWQISYTNWCTGSGVWFNINHDYSDFPWQNPGCVGD